MILISCQLEGPEWITNLLCSTFFWSEVKLWLAPLRLTCEHQRNKQAHPADRRGISQWLRLATNYKIWLVIFQPSGIWLWVVHLLVWWWILKLAFFLARLVLHRNIFNSCLFLLLMRFPASWKLLIGLPAFGFRFDYVRSTSTYLLSDLFYRPKLRAILSKLASGRAPWRNWTLCSGCSSTSSWIAQSLTRQEQWLSNYHAQVALAETQIFLATEVGAAFSRLEEGYEGALKQYYKKQID